MTDKMKCPFCGAELLGTPSAKYCPNEDCMCYSETISTSVWQALIDGKKAQDALNYALEILSHLDEIGGVDREIVKIKEMHLQYRKK